MAGGAKAGAIRIGVGGWIFPPWRGTFYPPGLPHARELAHASRQLTSIEINATFYRTQKPDTFRAWAAQTPDGFVFSVKGPGYVANRKDLRETGPGLARFLESGVTELGDRLGPILWQLAATKTFDPDEIAGFLDLLPRTHAGRPLRHVLEPRHESFRSPDFVALMRRANVAVVCADSEKYPEIADVTGDFVYARLQRSSAAHPAGYAAADLDAWAKRIRTWAAGGDPPDLPHAAPPLPKGKPRACFVYFIAGAKERNPAAATALMERVAPPTSPEGEVESAR
jgi:uncharacterized protein YecE (DUF72 family)